MKINPAAIGAVLLTFFLILVGIQSRIDTPNDNTPKASQGFLDLSHVRLDHNGPVKLDGEWEFVPGKLVGSIYFENLPSHYVPVPSLWTKYQIDGRSIPIYSSATYRLRIKINHKDQMLGLKTSNIRMSNSIWINGERIGQSGTPKENQSYTAHNTPYVTYFMVKDNLIEVIVHAANFHYASGGGILGSIYLGSAEDITNLREKSLAYDWIMIASLLIMGVYFAGFYSHLRKDVPLIYFSLFCFVLALYSATHGEKVLHLYLPGLSYEIFERLQGLSTISIGLFLFLFYHCSLRPFSHKKPASFLAALGVLLMGSMIFPVSINSKFQLLHSFYLLMVIVYVIYIQVSAIRARITGAIYLICASLALIVYFIVGTLNVMGDTRIDSLPPIFPFIYLAMLSLFMANRFADTYRKNEELSSLLLKADKLRDDFLAKASHEFRAPLQGIMNFTETLRDELKASLTQKQNESLQILHQISKRLFRLVNDIQDLSQLKQGQLHLDIKELDAHTSVQSIVQVFDYNRIGKDVRLVMDVPQNLPYVQADEYRFSQILYHVIDNAVSFTQSGIVEVKARQRKDFLEFSIIDTGIGIPEDQMEDILLPFQQVVMDSRINRPRQGSGLGLPISKQLVEQMGGTLRVESEWGRGTKVTFTIPSHLEAFDSQPSNKIPVPYEVHGKVLQTPFVQEKSGKYTILAADDDETHLKLLIDGLSKEGYNIIAVKNGKEVLEQLSTNRKIDLVLLDVMMPGISGYDVCKEIRKKYGLLELPVVMLTSAIHRDEMQAAYHVGANDFLYKPFDLHELHMRLRSLLMMSQSAVDMANMEVAFLQAQIKPHFLFNVLNTILALTYKDTGKARSIIMKLAEFLRGSFDFTNTERLVPFSQELKWVKAYVEIEQARFKDRITVDFQIPEGIDFLLPPLILQPLVENSIRHGIIPKTEGGRLRIQVEERNREISIHVEDNGVGFPPEKWEEVLSRPSFGKSVGLRNIQKRLQHLYGTELVMESNTDTGTRITIRIPGRTEKQGKESHYAKSSASR